MSTRFDPLKRPKTPPKVSWFEFLLCPSLLEEHLNKDVCEPNACELISLFLYQAELATLTAKEIAKSSSDEPIILDGDKHDEGDNKKVKALKALALRTASLLKWNLNALEEGLPLATVESILIELLTAALPGVEPIAMRHATLDLKSLTPEAVFAVLCYHRWCLRTGVKDTFPVRPSKVPNVQVPGLLDPSVQSANKKDSILRNVKDGLPDSVKVIEKFLDQSPNVTLPKLQCFTVVTENSDQQLHDWSAAQPIPWADIQCQVCYELGSLYFHQQEYEKANQRFLDARKYIPQLNDRVTCDLDEASLQGFVCACSGVLGRSVPGMISEEAKLVEAVESIRIDNFEGLTSVLMQDNRKCLLSLSYRLSLEEDVRAVTNSQTFSQEVMTCNMIRQAMEARLSPPHYIHMLSETPDHVEFLLDMATSILKTMTFSQKNNLKYFIRYLCYALPRSIEFPQKVAESDVKALFSQNELETLIEKWKEMKSSAPKPKPTEKTPAFPKTDDERVETAAIEHDLLVTYDPNVIKQLTHKLMPKIGRYNLLFLTDKWHLPKDLAQMIDGLPVPHQSFSANIYVMVAKARVATQSHMFTEARELLQTSDQAIKDISYRLSKLLRWEILKVDLLQHHHTEELPLSITHPEMIKRCRSAINSLLIEHDLQPAGEVTCLMTTYLLNQREWDFLSALTHKTAGYVELSKEVATLCKELPQMKNARKFARELWESVTLIYTSSSQQKRSAGGAGNTVNRESHHGLVSQQLLTIFLHKIKEPQVLTVFISLLTKLYNVLKDDLTVEISSDYLTLWPTTIGNTSSISVAAVTEVVTSVMGHALKCHPTHPSWLRTQADIQYASGLYAQAVKFYIQLGIVTTDYFTKPLTKNIYDENIYRRLIRCCNYLQCHTQIAVLCQFLDEVDYATAFKALQERNVHDAMDTYYDCFWDITILEFLTHFHHRRGEYDKKQEVLNLVGQLELNSSNPAEILFEAAKLRKSRFMRAMAREYLQTSEK